ARHAGGRRGGRGRGGEDGAAGGGVRLAGDRGAEAVAVTVRAGIIGLGVGEQHIAGYRAHPEAEVVALCDVDEAKRAMARERYPGLHVTADPLEVLTAEDIDVVSVASYDDAHFEQVRLA